VSIDVSADIGVGGRSPARPAPAGGAVDRAMVCS